MVVGLVIKRDRFPFAHEVFQGHTHDSNAVAHMPDLLDNRIGLEPFPPSGSGKPPRTCRGSRRMLRPSPESVPLSRCSSGKCP